MKQNKKHFSLFRKCSLLDIQNKLADKTFNLFWCHFYSFLFLFVFKVPLEFLSSPDTLPKFLCLFLIRNISCFIVSFFTVQLPLKLSLIVLEGETLLVPVVSTLISLYFVALCLNSFLNFLSCHW